MGFKRVDLHSVEHDSVHENNNVNPNTAGLQHFQIYNIIHKFKSIINIVCLF